MQSSEVKFNGVYQSTWCADIDQRYVDEDADENSGYYIFIRFYLDHTTIIAGVDSSRFNSICPTQIASWFKRENKRFNQALYRISGNVIEFSTLGENLHTDYRGLINGDLIDMTIVNRIYDITSQLQFNFIELEID